MIISISISHWLNPRHTGSGSIAIAINRSTGLINSRCHEGIYINNELCVCECVKGIVPTGLNMR